METLPSSLASKVTPRLLFTASVATALVFLYGMEFLSPQFLPAALTDSFKRESPRLHSHDFSLLFFSAFVSNTVFYNVQVDLRISIAISSLLFAFSAIASYFSTNVYLFCLSRVLTGLGAGISSSTVPCYLSFISPLNVKGAFSSLYSIGLVGGLLMDNLMADFFRANYHNVMLAIALCFMFIPPLLSFCVPFRNAEATKTGGSALGLFLNPKAYRSLLLVGSFHCIQNLCGINHISLNPASIYGPDYSKHQIWNLALGLVLTSVSGYLLSLFGRKALVITSTTLTMLSCVAFYFRVSIFLAAYCFFIGFNIGLSNIPYVIMSEVFPAKYVRPGALFGTSWNWISAMCSMLIATARPVMAYDPVFLLYIGCSAVFIAFVMASFRETKGREPEFQ